LWEHQGQHQGEGEEGVGFAAVEEGEGPADYCCYSEAGEEAEGTLAVGEGTWKGGSVHDVAQDDVVLHVRQLVLDAWDLARLSSSASLHSMVSLGTHVYPSNQPNEHGVQTSDHRRNPLAMIMLLPRNRLPAMVPPQAEALAFAKADVLSARMP